MCEQLILPHPQMREAARIAVFRRNLQSQFETVKAQAEGINYQIIDCPLGVAATVAIFERYTPPQCDSREVVTIWPTGKYNYAARQSLVLSSDTLKDEQAALEFFLIPTPEISVADEINKKLNMGEIAKSTVRLLDRVYGWKSFKADTQKAHDYLIRLKAGILIF